MPDPTASDEPVSEVTASEVTASEVTATQVPVPDIFAYQDHLSYLSDWFQAKKLGNPPVMLVDFAQIAGCSSGHVRNVVAGRRPLRGRLTFGFCRALGLSGPAAERFVDLVAVEEAPDEERTWMRQQLRDRARTAVLPERAALFLAPVARALRESGVPVDARTLARISRPPVAIADAGAAIEEGDSESDVMRSLAPGLVEVPPPGTPQDARAGYHVAALRHARSVHYELPIDEPRFHFWMWAAPERTPKRWKKALEAYIAEIQQLCDEAAADTSGDPVLVHQILLQLFPISDPSL